MSRSVRRIKKNNGRKQYLVKWRMSNSVFRTYYLKMGQPFAGSVTEPEIPWLLKLKDRIKLLFTV